MNTGTATAESYSEIAKPATVGFWQRAASKAVLSYLRHSPINRGKWQALRFASSFLVVEIEPGLMMRIDNPEGPEKALVYGLAERDEISAILDLVQPGMTFFDVGANIGLYSLMVANRVGPHGAVHAFEPTPRLVNSLYRQIELNSMDNVSVNEVAVSDRGGTASFHFHRETDLSSFAAVSDRAVLVPTITLDEYVADNGIAHVDLMKIDVEGAEALVLRGAERLLSGPHAPAILMEINPAMLKMMSTNSDCLMGMLHGYGYSVRTLAEHEGYRNVLATKA